MVSVVNPEDGIGGIPVKVVNGRLGSSVAQETRQHQHYYWQPKHGSHVKSHIFKYQMFHCIDLVPVASAFLLSVKKIS